MDSGEYWKKREAENLRENQKTEQRIFKEIQSQYAYMADSIEKEINGFYTKYAKKEGITMAEARKRVSQLDIDAYSLKAKKYVKDKDFSAKANEEMRIYNATMRINRLELLKANIGLEMVSGFEEVDKTFGEALTSRAMEEYARQAGILGSTVQDTQKTARNIANASFKNATYSDRVWMYQTQMKSELSKLLQEGLIQGRNPRALASHMLKLFGASRYDAERLLVTEMARVQTDVQKDSFVRNGYEQYEFIALGSACDTCRGIDGKHFDVSKMMPGENAPPMHPNCRCSVSAYMAREEFDKWLDEQSPSNYKLSDTTDKWAKEARRELLKSEKSISSRDKETMEIYDSSGRYIMSRRGGTNSVRLSVLDYPKLKNAVVTHNHPSGGSFSIDDLKFLNRMPISELRVAGIDRTYFIRKPQNWPKEIISIPMMEEAFKYTRNSLKHKYQKLYNEGEITRAQRHQLFSDEANKIFAERYGLDYGYEFYE